MPEIDYSNPQNWRVVFDDSLRSWVIETRPEKRYKQRIMEGDKVAERDAVIGREILRTDGASGAARGFGTAEQAQVVLNALRAGQPDDKTVGAQLADGVPLPIKKRASRSRTSQKAK